MVAPLCSVQRVPTVYARTSENLPPGSNIHPDILSGDCPESPWGFPGFPLALPSQIPPLAQGRSPDA